MPRAHAPRPCPAPGPDASGPRSRRRGRRAVPTRSLAPRWHRGGRMGRGGAMAHEASARTGTETARDRPAPAGRKVFARRRFSPCEGSPGPGRGGVIPWSSGPRTPHPKRPRGASRPPGFEAGRPNTRSGDVRRTAPAPRFRRDPPPRPGDAVRTARPPHRRGLHRTPARRPTRRPIPHRSGAHRSRGGRPRRTPFTP